ncbi:hypothetical protein [[Flexibacter] sp. ATCC 35208]|uniref:hypothetical protein n=1 Tax=[Flexibacter] sp. ATCC 35208 TaxID=1936242 RepID=UPI0009D53755|nr:hypothetical protein [[Flexibacter] sp. ATCC 35208]OMP77724.1 hypothetical protein BW716_18505 [[Flexibacter] sp. ATCC 35208]
MRHLLLYIIIFFSFYQAGAHVCKKKYEAVENRKPVTTVLKVVKSDPKPGWRKGTGYLPETIVDFNNCFSSPNKCVYRPATGHFSAYFIPRLPLYAVVLSTGRLLVDIHAIVRTLIFPNHIFW